MLATALQVLYSHKVGRSMVCIDDTYSKYLVVLHFSSYQLSDISI